jgi:hypothetical protein
VTTQVAVGDFHDRFHAILSRDHVRAGFRTCRYRSATSQDGWQIGAVGHAYQQLTGDTGDGAVLGDFESRIFGAGPQIGYSFPIGGALGNLKIKG